MENRVDKEISVLLTALVANKSSLINSNSDFLVEEDIDAQLMPFKLPNDLSIFYKWLYEKNFFKSEELFYFFDQGTFTLQEAINQRNHLIEMFLDTYPEEAIWPSAWLPIAFKGNALIIAILSKEHTDKTMLLECHLGDGDTNGYLFFSSLEGFLRCEIAIAKSRALGEFSWEHINSFIKIYSPNSWEVSDNAYTENHFNNQGQRNVFDIFDLENMPKAWL